MTRLSDSLRGLADRAPIDEATVSVPGAARRIQRGKRMRAAANATAGVGVATVVALAAIHPGGANDLTAADRGLESVADGAGGGEAPAIAGADDSFTRLAWGLCGSRPFDSEVPDASDEFSLQLSEFDGEVAPGTTVTTEITATALTEEPYTTEPTSLMVLWDGYVVGTAQAPPDRYADYLEDSDPIPADVPLVNCWDGGELPPGSYELVASKGFYAAAAEEPPLPSEPSEPSVGPLEPLPDPSEPTGTAGEPGADDTTRYEVEGGGVSGPTGTSDSAAVAPAAGGEFVRAVSNHVKLVIEGDAPADPFGQYLGGDPEPAANYPDDYLYPAIAREEYAAHLSAERWNMAQGTQRVVMTADGLQLADGEMPTTAYFGCAWDGSMDPTFPAESATWDLLDVTASVPSRIDVSYGWVVEDNPLIDLAATNVSSYTLPGYWGEPNASLVLVKDGRVVAEAYLAPTNRSGEVTTLRGDGMLGPDATVSGTYLWRDVSGCWTGDRQADVTPGTYTVLNVQHLYLDNGAGGVGGGVIEPYYGGAALDDIASSSSTGGAAASEPMPRDLIAPAPDQGAYDYVELQVWTSLGTISVS